MADLTFERMSDHFLKVHLGHGMVLHIFTGADGPYADPHDHAQWGFTSTVLWGGYIEECFELDGTSKIVERRERDSFRISPHYIHRIIRLFSSPTITLIEPEAHTGEREKFFQFREDGVYVKLHDTGFFKLEV